MAKIQRSTVKVVNNEDNEVVSEYLSEEQPFESQAGNCWFIAIPCTTIPLIQADERVYSTEEMCRSIEDKYGLPEGSVGSRGIMWNTPEAREKYSVFVDEVEFRPELSQAALKAAAAKADRVPRVRADTSKAHVKELEEKLRILTEKLAALTSPAE